MPLLRYQAVVTCYASDALLLLDALLLRIGQELYRQMPYLQPKGLAMHATSTYPGLQVHYFNAWYSKLSLYNAEYV